MRGKRKREKGKNGCIQWEFFSCSRKPDVSNFKITDTINIQKQTRVVISNKLHETVTINETLFYIQI